MTQTPKAASGRRKIALIGAGNIGGELAVLAARRELGDVVLVEAIDPEAEAPEAFALRQIPNVQGGIVAIDPHTGRVVAMQGGYSFDKSVFNRATQALR